MLLCVCVCVCVCRGGRGVRGGSPLPWIFKFVTLPLKIPEKKVFILEILQRFVTPLWISNVKNQNPWRFHINFLWTPLKISGNYICLFFYNSSMQFDSSCGFHTSFNSCLSWFQKFEERYWHNTIDQINYS